MTASKLIETARSYLGVAEGSAAHRALIDKYNTIRPLPRGYRVAYTDAWCAVFVAFCALISGTVLPLECGCQEMYAAFPVKKSRTATPGIGWAIFYDWNQDGHTEHVGIVESVKDGVITAIEGNHNDRVGRRQIRVGDPTIYGYGVPEFKEDKKVSNAQTIWDYLLKWIGNAFGAAGLMGNLRAESALRPNNLQDRFEQTLGLSDAQYTTKVDDGSYGNFIFDSAGYGLAQWTFWSRKKALLEYARARKASIGDLYMQLDFLKKEMVENYPTLVASLQQAKTVREASNAVLFIYERPGDQGQKVQDLRTSSGEECYNLYAQKDKKEYPALVPGSQGDRVKWWQDGLLALGFADCSFYFAESGFNNGYYGDHTKNFTSRFQAYFGLMVDGCAGEESQKKMEEELAKWNFNKLNFTVEQLMDRAEKVSKKYKVKGYKWGSADIAPWYQPEILKASCDRGQDEIFHTLLELGNREAKEISRRLLELGGEKITDVRDVQAGDVVFLNSWHVFLAASGRDANGCYKRYDFGNDDRFAADQPFTEPISDFGHAVRVCKKAADPDPKMEEAKKYTVQIEQIGLGSDGPSVGIAQAILKGQGYYVGKIDDDFGPKTDTAVREWQADKIVEGKPVGGADGEPDGIIGRDSWSELLKIDVKA